jgi:hypothetical protein
MSWKLHSLADGVFVNLFSAHLVICLLLQLLRAANLILRKKLDVGDVIGRILGVGLHDTVDLSLDCGYFIVDFGQFKLLFCFLAHMYIF